MQFDKVYNTNATEKQSELPDHARQYYNDTPDEKQKQAAVKFLILLFIVIIALFLFI
jgi:hypothetical protein